MAKTLKLRRLKFKAGSAPGQPQLDVETPDVTVIVGPNNSGKSQTLREIEEWCQGKNTVGEIVDELELTLPDTFADVREMLDLIRAEPPRNQVQQPGHFWIARPIVRQGEEALHQQINERNLEDWYKNNDIPTLRQVFVRPFTLRLDGRTRFDLVEQKQAGPLEGNPQNHLWALFVDDLGREKVREFTEEAFGKHFVIDPTGMTHFRVRLSNSKPTSKPVEQALDAAARDFHKGAPLVSTLGDGVRASIGLVSAIVSLSQRILLIDEPEAFLHPTLARRVGRTISRIAREREATLIVATHSAEMLMGCIQATPQLRLIRLTYLNGQSTARSIEPAEVSTLMNDPLLRSTNALRALFHRGVIVAEADADRAFYEEINHRLLTSSRGVEDGLFMNAQNWQTIPRITVPLRRLGIPAAGVFDFDVLLDTDFGRHIWPLLYADAADLARIQAERGHVKLILEGAGRKKCKDMGVKAIDGPDADRVKAFISELSSYGVFFVPVGELECWLSGTGIAKSNNKAAWLTAMFEALGSDPDSSSYVRPGDGDVWRFLDQIEEWVTNPDRKGIPI